MITTKRINNLVALASVVIAVDSGPHCEHELSDINWKRHVEHQVMTLDKFKQQCAGYGFVHGELTGNEQTTWDRCASNAEYHYLSSGKAFVRFGKALAEGMLAMEQKRVRPESSPKQDHARSAEPYPVVAPPAELKAKAFYKKYVDAGGYPILASGTVNDYALKEAAFLVDKMLAKRPDIKRAMVASGSRMLILAHNEFTTDLPEFAHMKPKDYWDARARGTGGSATDPYCSCGEENLLGYAGDPYPAECILIHEFAHNIHLRGMSRVDPTFDKRLKQTYQRAMAAGLWKTKYASVNHYEYFAEGVQSWFDNNRPPDHDHNHVDTRKELREYDPGLARICEEVFGDTKLTYTQPTTRLKGHLAGYDPRQAPTFRWPKRLDQARAEIRQKARQRSEKPTE